MKTSPPKPPYYVVIFTSIRTEGDEEAYQELAAQMVELASSQPGYLGFDHFQQGKQKSVSISYWQDEDALLNWKKVTEHQAAQKQGRDQWYQWYKTEVARVERAYDFEKT